MSDSPLASNHAVDPCTLVIFGASGDLTARKLIPAMYEMARDGIAPGRDANSRRGSSPEDG